MGTDELFKKRRAARKKRQHDIRTPQANSYLIITEGTRTEPFYFKGLQKLIQETIGGTIQVVEVPAIDIYGEGCATGKLIEEARQLVKKAKIFYQNVWIVFDKDDFEDFDQAIQEGEANGYKIAWSNQS
ncbi:MAG: RloB family protein, partial [Lachnospiraceae bacterium]|nr:RloB family protein [Lachnospiraceae bacterium]